ncbi:MAG: UbiA family prenyltransferase [Pirellulaceae bacterium]
MHVRTDRSLLPLFVDLDGTLIKADLLAESAFTLLKQRPWYVVMMLFWLISGGRARLKSEVACRVTMGVDTVPFQTQLVDFLLTEAAKGRPIHLATASDRRLAEPVAARLGVFRHILASDGATNLKGHHKLEAILAVTNHTAFAYAGNGRADLDIWDKAAQAIVVNPAAGITTRAKKRCEVERIFDDRPPVWRRWLRATRMYQWLKNLLLFVPLLTAHAFNAAAFGKVLVAFLAFGCVASATYILNDLLDLNADRRHPRKRTRPFASGDIPIAEGFVALVLLFALGILIAATVSASFLAVVLAYLILTIAYSWYFKTYVLIDVLLLASLYTIRIVAGAVAIDVTLSSWLLGFSIFLFFSLALVKRTSELAALVGRGEDVTSRRDYRVTDYDTLNSMGIASGYLAVVILALFIDSPSIQEHYSRPELLWLLCPAMLYWVSRLWLKTARDEMHEDPLIYSLRDRGSWLVLLSMILITLCAV